MITTVGQNIKKLREQQNINQEELAQLVGVSSQAVSKWETDESKPSLETLVKISRVFHVSVDALVTGIDDYDVFDNENIVNFKLRQIYCRAKRGEGVNGALNDVITTIFPLSASDKDHYWMCSARLIVKATLLAMIEDKNITQDSYTLDKLKDILQMHSTNSADKPKKILEYFADKSNQCKELISVFPADAKVTAEGMLTMVATQLNLLSF